MSLSPYTSTLASGAYADVVTETYDVDTRGRKGLVLITDTTVIGNGHSYVQGAAVTLPYVSSAGANTSFKFNTVEYTIPAGTYTTLATLATAVNGALNGATRFDTVVTVTASGTGLLFTNVASGVHAEAFAVGTTHDALVTLGITAAWTIAHTGAAGADGAYSMTVSILGVDPVSTRTWTILAGAAMSTVTTQILQVSPAMVASANLVANAILPATIRVSVTHTTTNSQTKTVAAQLVS